MQNIPEDWRPYVHQSRSVISHTCLKFYLKFRKLQQKSMIRVKQPSVTHTFKSFSWFKYGETGWRLWTFGHSSTSCRDKNVNKAYETVTEDTQSMTLYSVLKLASTIKHASELQGKQLEHAAHFCNSKPHMLASEQHQQQYLATKNVAEISQPPYSPDLPSHDFLSNDELASYMIPKSVPGVLPIVAERPTP